MRTGGMGRLFTVHHSDSSQKKRSTAALLHSKYQVSPLLGWRWRSRSTDIDVNFRRAAAAKQTPPKNISRSQNHNHENNQHGNNTGAAATISIVSHGIPPPVCRGIE